MGSFDQYMLIHCISSVQFLLLRFLRNFILKCVVMIITRIYNESKIFSFEYFSLYINHSLKLRAKSNEKNHLKLGQKYFHQKVSKQLKQKSEWLLFCSMTKTNSWSQTMSKYMFYAIQGLFKITKTGRTQFFFYHLSKFYLTKK